MSRLLLLLSAFLSVTASAQTDSDKKETLLRFTAFGLAEGGGDHVLVAGEKQTEAFVIPGNGFSAPVPSPAAEGRIALGTIEDDVFNSRATINLPDTGKRFLVILLPAEGDELRAITIRADDPTFRPGQIMILNLARETLAADLGGEKMTFTPGSRTIFRPQRRDELANYQVRFFQARDGKPRLFAANLWPYFDEKRAFVFLHTDPTTGSPSYRSIDEFTGWLAD